MSIRRHLPSEVGPVPITPAMNPDSQSLNESTIRSFKKAYLIAIRFNPALEAVERAALKKKKRGKPLKFGKHDAEIIANLRAIRKAGGKVNRTVVQGAAFGITCCMERTLSQERGVTHF